MSFSEEWNDIYGAGKQMTRWPWTDLVSSVKRHCGDIKGWNVLELGSGAGPNMPFFVIEEADYHGIEASITGLRSGIVDGRVVHGDFTELVPNAWGAYDLICDRAAVTHNDTEAIKRCLRLVHAGLKPGGWFIGIDWFSNLHADAEAGQTVDEHTRCDIPSGQFEGVGRVHFSDAKHLDGLFAAFEVVAMDHKIIVPRTGEPFASWNIVARKSA